MPFGHHKTTEQPQTADAHHPVGPLGTGTGPEMEPAVRQPYETRAHAPTATQGGSGAYAQGMTYLPPQQQQGGMNDPYANVVGNNDVAPVNHFSNGQHTGSGTSTTGKIERVIGTVLHNPKLKAKGIEKEREAQAHKAQSMELSEAERLEHEASLRRERAVQHGAHPANKALGGAVQAQEFGGNFGTGLDNSALGPNAPLSSSGRGQLL